VHVVVVPAYLSRPHEPAQLSRCAHAVLGQAAIDHLVVVDDGSPLPVPPLPERAEVIRLPANAGPAAARNRGIARALELGAAMVLFTDVDCVPDPGWAEALVRFVERSGHVAAGGVTRSLGTTLLDRYHDFSGTLNGRWLLPDRTSLLYATTCNMAVRTGPLAAVRFDERFPTAAGEDVDFCHRLRTHGTIGFAPGAVVRHDFAYPSTLGGLGAFLRMIRRYGEADPLLREKHPELPATRSEACAAADVLAATPPADPAAYRRGASSRVRPRRYRLPLMILRELAGKAYRRGLANPRPWRAPVAGSPAASAPVTMGPA
jgi:glycosyltransferase involved in cell wall biosynthesis